MDIHVFDLKEDKKVMAKCILIDIKIAEYIELIKENLEELEIQRGKIISRKREVYRRLTEDLKEGTIMPPISLTLSKKTEVHNKIKNIVEIKEMQKEINKKIRKGDLFILDGVQRTHCILNVIEDLKNVEPDKLENFRNQRIRTELWFNMTYTALLYKMLVLNTGQVKMSMKHQIEILNIPLREKISEIASQKEISIKFSTYKTHKKIDKLYAYKFSDIVEAFTSFVTKDPIVDKTNEVVKELERMRFVEEHSNPETLSKEEEINEFTEILIEVDKLLYEKYRYPIEDEEGQKLPWTSRNNVMGSAAILSGIFASFGKKFATDKERYIQRKEKLFQILQNDARDPLKVEIMSKILQDEKKRTTKFGETTRNFFFSAFREFFNGEDNFEEIWKRAVRS